MSAPIQLPLTCPKCDLAGFEVIEDELRFLVICGHCGARIHDYILIPEGGSASLRPVERSLLEHVPPLTQMVYEVLRRTIAQEGIAPSRRELAEMMGYSGHGSVSRHLKKLEEVGLISYEPGAARAIRLPEARLRRAG